jgi:hypothetical protein
VFFSAVTTRVGNHTQYSAPPGLIFTTSQFRTAPQLQQQWGHRWPALVSALVCLLLLLGAVGAGQAQTQAQFVRADALTQGNWKSTYGAEGYQIINDAQALPSFARLAASGQLNYTWQAPTSDGRALQRATSSERLAATWFNVSSLSLNLNLTDGQLHQVALYCLDWDAQARQQRIDVLDAATGALLDSRAISNFTNGLYLVWQVRGNVTFRVTCTGGHNAVVSGLFLNAANPAPPTPTRTRTTTTSGVFLRADTTTRGAWKTTYGLEGRNVINDVSAYPSYAQVSASGQGGWVWEAATSDGRALQRVATSGNIAACWFAETSFTVSVNLTDGLAHQVALYLLDWDNRARSQKIELLDSSTDAVLDARTVAGFTGGQYLVWQVTGSVKFRLTRLGGDNAVLSGIFFGAGTGSPTRSPVVSATPSPTPTPTPVPTPTVADTTPPVISAVTSLNLTGSSATVSWTTNEASDSTIEYGTSTAYGNQSTLTPLVTSHQVSLVGLAPGTRYNYRVLSKDAAGNTAQSANYTFTTTAAAPAPTPAPTAGGPELPRVYLNTTYTPPSGRTLTVNAGGNLQDALNSAVPGDTIVLQAGATYVAPSGGYVLPYKANPNNQWIVIRSSDLGSLPAAGDRVTPSHAGALPKILSRDTMPALVTAAGANYWRLLGLEISLTPDAFADAPTPDAPINYGLIFFGSHSERDVNNLATDLIVDRCYIHGQPRKNVRRGIMLNSRRTAIIDSYLSEFHEIGSDSQAICGWNGPGPYKIVNNRLEGAGENILFGGADPVIPNLVPSDLEIRRNHFYKPLSWRNGDPSYAGVNWSVKNLFELKNARRVLIDGNVFENNWLHSQNGFAILFTVANQDGGAPWTIVADITFTNNLVRNAGGGVNVLGKDYRHESLQAQRLLVKNNVFANIDAGQWGGLGRFLQTVDSIDLRVENNTVFHSGNVGTGYTGMTQPANSGFVFRNNVASHNEYGFIGDGMGIGLPSLNAYFPNAVFTGNILAGGPAWLYPAGNHFPSSLDGVGFVNRAGGDYRLAASSAFKGKGSDGRDPGADIEGLNAALSGVVP